MADIARRAHRLGPADLRQRRAGLGDREEKLGVGRPAGGHHSALCETTSCEAVVMAYLLVGSLKRTAQPLRLDSTAHVAAEYSRRADLSPWGRRSASGGAVPTPGLAGQHARGYYNSL